MTTFLSKFALIIVQIFVAVALAVAVLKFTGTTLTEKQLILFSVLIGVSGPVLNFFSPSPTDKTEVVKLTLVSAVTAIILTGIFVLAINLNWLNF